MVRTLEQSEFDRLPRRGRRGSFPWDEWTDGTPRLVDPEAEYEISKASFRTALYGEARRLGLYVETIRTEEGIAFRFTSENPNPGHRRSADDTRG